jgi:prepilin-type N-terminal cleavage/methylation domain-containing protein
MPHLTGGKETNEKQQYFPCYAVELLHSINKSAFQRLSDHSENPMSMSFKRRVASGFTLIELLIVVIILAILAAIAIPQFTASTSDAQLAALDSNLSAVRTALEQYKVQHTGNVYPGANIATGGASCPTGGAAVTTGAAGSKDAMVAQLQYYTNAAGQACTTGGGLYKYGPYLRQGLPSEPITNSTAIVVTTTGTQIAPAAATGGWAYDTASGQFVMNSNATDSASRKYSDH